MEIHYLGHWRAKLNEVWADWDLHFPDDHEGPMLPGEHFMEFGEDEYNSKLGTRSDLHTFNGTIFRNVRFMY